MDDTDHDGGESEPTIRLDVGGWISGPCFSEPVTEDELAALLARAGQAS